MNKNRLLKLIALILVIILLVPALPETRTVQASYTARIAICGTYGDYYETASDLIYRLEQLGCYVRKISSSDDISDFDGLVVPGGVDVTPSCYGESSNGAYDYDLGFDNEQMAIISKFVAVKKPILGICRGMQLLNVYFGGTLYQDISGHRGGVTHYATTESWSKMRSIVGESAYVYCTHHQSVKRLGSNLLVTMTSSDGMYEAMEHTRLPIIAVQWHPEWMSNQASSNLFDYFINDMCRKYDPNAEVAQFYDVQATHSYYSSVKWAADNSIAGGYSNGLFGVSDSVTRSQVVTFLWRAAGKPAPKGMTQTFTDVPVNSNFYRAIQWAYEQGITGGYTGARAGQFGPSDNCTRGQIVTFLWRYAGKPAPKGKTQTFTDVPAYSNFYKAIQWAYEHGITAGYRDGSFGVNRTCTRGQCVTFLYRMLSE